MKAFVSILEDAWAGWKRHRSERLSAALAFYTMFSLAPVLMLVTAVLGSVLGEQAVRGDLEVALERTMGHEAAVTVSMLAADAYDPAAGLTTAIAGLLTMAWAASRMVTQLEGALDTIWESGERKDGLVKALVLRRGVAVALVLGVGALVVGSLTVSAVLQAQAAWLASYLPIPSAAIQQIDGVVSFVTLTLAFALMYGALPARREAWLDLLAGGAMTAMLFVLGKFGIALYLGRTGATSAYGAASALVLLLLWLYYSSMTVMFGAELTQAFARWRRSDPRSAG